MMRIVFDSAWRAIDVVPAFMRSAAMRELCAALDRGEDLLLPGRPSNLGTPCWFLEQAARRMVARVYFEMPVDRATTRERVDA